MKTSNNLIILAACAWLWSYQALAGTLVGTQTTAPASANLTAEGTLDWAHWGLNAQSDFDHKASGANQISNAQITGNPTQFGDAAVGYTWSDGTPTAAAAFSTTGIYIEGLSHAANKTNGFQFAVAAAATNRVLKVYAGAWNAQVRFEARLSDGSAPAYVDDTLDDTGAGTSVMYTVRFAANSPGQTLTIRIYSLVLHDPAGNSTLMAASLGTPSTGTLEGLGTLLPNGSVVNLSGEGGIDWTHWGLATATDFNHKSGVPQKISNITPVGSGSISQIGTIPAAYSWTGGTPTAASSNTSGIYVSGEGNGFQFTVPADTTVRLLRVYVTAYSARVHFQATLSDGSATPLSDDSFDATADQQAPVRVYTVRYASTAASQTLTIQCTVLVDEVSGWVSLQAATLQLIPAQTGVLGGGYTVLAVASTVDLTDEGHIDWAHWGLTQPTDLDRKIGGGSVISDFSVIGLAQGGGALEVQWFGDNFTAYSWTDGTPTLSATNTGSGIWLAQTGGAAGPGLNTGFEVSVPADTAIRALKVYVGCYGSRMHFEASLSDGSAPPFIDESFANPGDGPNRVYTLTFAAASGGQKLIVRWWNMSLYDPFANVTLQSAVLREAAPIVSLLTPANASIFYDAAGGMHFTASTIAPFSIAANQVGLELNGTDLSSSLVVSGTPTARSAVYTNLVPNRFYIGHIRAVDNLGHGTTNFVTFDTFSTNGVVVIEVEDYNHDAGQFIDNPAPGAYAGLAGTAEIDYHTANTAINDYRSSDPLEIPEAVETRPYFIDAGLANHAVTDWNLDDWLNFTRVFPAGVYHVYLRYGGTVDQSVQLDLVTGDRTQPNPTLAPIGLLNAPQLNSDAIYRYAALQDTNGNLVGVSLSGVQTLRMTGVDVGAGLPADFLMLVPSGQQPLQLSISRGVNQVTLAFQTRTGLTYTLQYKDSLTEATWHDILPTIPGDGSVKSVNQATTQPSRFFRVSAH